MEIEVTDESFQKEVIEKSKKIPVLVDFWAAWCGPCRMLTPILEDLSKEYKGKFILAKLDVEENQRKAGEYGVMSIPSVKLFKKGQIVDEFIGAIPKDKVKIFIDKNL